MLYDESLDDYGHEDHELTTSTNNTIHDQGVIDGGSEDAYDPREGSSHMDGAHYQIIPEMMEEYEDEHTMNGEMHHHVHSLHHVNERGEEVEMIGDEVEMVEMEEVIDETGQRMYIRDDGTILYPPDFDDDGSTITWRLVEEDDGSAVDMSGMTPLEMVHHQQPLAFDVSAYEVCQSVSSHTVHPRVSRGRQSSSRRPQPLIPASQRFARLDRPYPNTNPRHAKISRIDVSKGRAQGKREGVSGVSSGVSPSLSSLPRLPPPAPPPRVPRRPTAKHSTQVTLADSTSGLETANCNYCHLRFYMPRTALRSRISYGTTDSHFDLPSAFFECPICGMESASGPSSSRR